MTQLQEKSQARAQKTAESLRQLYNFGSEDEPAKVLGSYPNSVRVIEALKVLIDILFPGRFSSGVSSEAELLPFLSERLSYLDGLLRAEFEHAIPFRWLGAATVADKPQAVADVPAEAENILENFFVALPVLRKNLIEDVRAAYQGDPAALTYAEVQVAYPGLLAVASHRVAHQLYRLDVPVIPRIMSEWTHTQTGIDIHPGAQIGSGFFIDHGTGVVIGETSKIGNNVRIYQGATLGAKSFPLNELGQPVKHIKRHPTIEDDVIIYANAILLGGETVIGRGSTIGAGVCVMESVPEKSLVIANRPELKIKRANSVL